MNLSAMREDFFVLRKADLSPGASSKGFPGGVQMQEHRLGMKTVHGVYANSYRRWETRLTAGIEGIVTA